MSTNLPTQPGAEVERDRERGAATDPGTEIARQRYSEGIVRRPIGEEETDARALYRVLAEIGGAELVGPARELAAGTFYRPAE